MNKETKTIIKIDDYIPNNDVTATLATRSILLKVADDKKFLESWTLKVIVR